MGNPDLSKNLQLFNAVAASLAQAIVAKTTNIDAMTLQGKSLADIQGMISTAIADLVNSSPAALDTLKELANALGNDPDFATTITNQLALKAPLASPTFTGDPKAPTQAVTDNSNLVATTAFAQRLKAVTQGANMLINGDMQVNQRGFAGGALAINTYGYDRWKAGSGGSNSVGAGTNGVITLTGTVVQWIENMAPLLAGMTICVSVEDPSAALNIYAQASSGDTTAVGGIISAGSGRQGVALTIPSGATGHLAIIITANTTNTTLKRIKAEVGSGPTGWDQRTRPQEVQLCFRYYYRNVTKQYVTQGTIRGTGNSASFIYFLPTRMRTTPAGNVITPGTVFNINGASAVNLGSGTQTIVLPGPDAVCLNAAGITASTAGQPCTIDTIQFELDAEI